MYAIKDINQEEAMNAQTLTWIQGSDLHEPELIDVDMPFDAREVEEGTCKAYVEQLSRSDMPILPAAARSNKRNLRAALATDHVFDPIDVDMPFSASEVATLTSETYVAVLGRSDMPVWR
jgi:hypothetical protein